MTRFLPAVIAAIVLIQDPGRGHDLSRVAAKSTRAKATPQSPRAAALPDYFKILRISGASFSSDESLIAYASDEGGRMDIWTRPVEGGAARQVTHVKGAIESFEFSPKDDRLVFSADLGGNELTALYFTDSHGRAPEPLFPGESEKTRNEFVRWADDGKTLLYTSNRREEKSMDLYEFDLTTKKSTQVWENTRSFEFVLTSRDHRRFVFMEEISDADSNLYLAERGGKELRLLTPHRGAVRYSAADFSPDGGTLYYTSDENREFAAAYSMDLSTGTSRPILSPEWDVYGARFSKGGSVFFTSVNNDGSPEIAFTDATNGRPVTLPPIANGKLVSAVFSSSDRWIAARVESDSAPRSLWLLDRQKQTARPLFDPLPASLRGKRFATAASIRATSFDGRRVPALLFVPEDRGKPTRTNAPRLPAVIDIHGGPTSQSVRTFRPFTQYLVSKGYVVLVPNVRGSVGYGKTYTSLDNKDFGGGPLKDVLACKAWLVQNAHVDPNRVAIMGQSYGGYMTLAAATFAPTEFAAHIDLFGISDLKSLVEGFPTYWESAMPYIYQKFGNPNDPQDAAYQRARSPLYFAERIRRPLLIIQGENDPRVHKDQSDRLVKAVRRRGVPVEYVVIRGEGHGFSKTENQVRALEATDRFLERYVAGR